MTAREEDILTNQNYIQNGTVIDKLLQSLIVTQFNYNDLLIGDKNAILVAARILGYGSEYEFKYKDQKVSIDLTTLKEKELDKNIITEGKNEFNYKLPHLKRSVTFKLLTHGDDQKIQNEVKGLKKINKQASSDVSTRLKHTIISVDGNYETADIREFVDNHLLARDARELRKYMTSVNSDVDMTVDLDLPDGTQEEGVSLPIGISFFWPDAGI